MKTIGYYTSPKLAEAVIQTIRQAFDSDLEWLDNSYPLVQTGNIDGETFPMVYDGGDNIDLRPDDSVDSYCFFEFAGGAIGNDDDPAVYTFNVVFWCNLDQVNSSTEDYTWNMIGDVLRILKPFAYDISFTTNDVFSEYNFELERQQLMKKYTGFKIMFTVYGDNFMCDFG